jgi:hypothetical protein
MPIIGDNLTHVTAFEYSAQVYSPVSINISSADRQEVGEVFKA